MAEFIDKNSKEFEDDILDKANMYSCCVFLGRGKYSTAYFLTQQEAQGCKTKLLADNPHARILIYAMVVDPANPNRVQQTLVI